MGGIAACLALAWTQATVFVVTPGAEDALSLRASDRVALHLDRLGAPVLTDRAWLGPPPGIAAIRVWAEQRKEGEGLRLRARTGPNDFLVTGPRRRFDRACAEIALELREVEGERFPPDTLKLLAEDLPWKTHELLGKARQRERDGQYLQAALLFDRASRIGDRISLEALQGRSRVRNAGRSESRRRDGELAKAAAVQAAVAARKGAPDAARQSWLSFLKYAPDRGEAFGIPHPPVGAARMTRGRVWYDAPSGRLSFPLGPPVKLQPTEARLEATGPTHLVVRRGRDLRRLDVPRPGVPGVGWSRTLSFVPTRVETAGGFLGVSNGQKLVWIDPSLGNVTDVVDGVEVLAFGERGALVRRDDRLQLLRSGQTSAAWSRPLAAADPPISGLLTAERALVGVGRKLLVLRTHNGQPVKFGSATGRWIWAGGRFAVFADGSEVGVVDILAGRTVVRRSGPDELVAAVGRSRGVTLAFRSGDIQWISEDGETTKRGRIAGSIQWLVATPAHLLIGTKMGVVGVDDSTAGDFDAPAAVLELATTARKAGRQAEASKLAQWSARRGLSRVAHAERLRAELLPEGPAQEYALERARSAEDLAQPLLPFRIAGAPRPVPETPTARTSSTGSSRSPRRR